MVKLINLSTYSHDIQMFNYDQNKIINFLQKNGMDGIELLNPIMWDENIIPRRLVKGVHLRYYPAWFDFWKGNREALLKQFKTMDDVEKYYGGINRESIIEYYKKEIRAADKIGAEYVVFHVSHVQLEHIYNYKFTYSDLEIIDAAVELINEIFKGLNTNVKLLFENLWWPGLTMLNKDMAYRMLGKVNYSNKGFMLDTGHLMNTNYYIENETQAVEYILNTTNNLGELKSFIKGIHLNCSLSGAYVMEEINKNNNIESMFNSRKTYGNAYSHVLNIDQHKPFRDKSVSKIIEFIKPEYVVYEFITSSLAQLEQYIKIQDEALDRGQRTEDRV